MATISETGLRRMTAEKGRFVFGRRDGWRAALLSWRGDELNNRTEFRRCFGNRAAYVGPVVKDWTFPWQIKI